MPSEATKLGSVSENASSKLAATDATLASLASVNANKIGVEAKAGQRDKTSGLAQQWHSQTRNLRIIHVGAGATGLCTAYKMRNQLQDYELVCYEKNDSIGGTWLENKYPGCACDVPAHIYTYTFRPNPNWTSYYAYSSEILDYFERFYRDEALEESVKLKHKVLGARWHDEKNIWEVGIEHDGLLNRWRCLNPQKTNPVRCLTSLGPNIKGLHAFQGPILHSAQWDDSVDYASKRVAVLGTGSSSIQIVPQVQKVAQKVECYLRSPTWIAPPMPRVSLDLPISAGLDLEAPNSLVQQYFYRQDEIEYLRNSQEEHLSYRKQIEVAINRGFAIFYKDTEASRMAEWYMRSEMEKRLGDNSELKEKLIPSWPVGCRRLTPGDGYLEALIESNVQCHFQEIAGIDEPGLTLEDGTHQKVDIIVCATGFDMAWTPHFALHGIGGVNIKDAWSPMPQSYLGIAAPGFPNYWVMNGPRGNLGNGTVLPCLETQIEYVIAAAKKMQADRIEFIDVKPEVIDRLNDYIDKWMTTSVFSGDCKSWYKNNTVDGKVMCWGGSSIHYLKTLKTPRWEHYDLHYVENDPWGFLGNGRIRAEVEDDAEGMTAYIRNADVPWKLL